MDTWDRPPVEKIKVVEKTIEGKPPIRGHIKGFVHEKEKSEGVANAIVAWENHPELTALATGVDGRFTTQELPEGSYNFALKADGFKDATCAGSLKGGQDVQIDCPLEALPRVGSIVGHVKDAETQAGIGGATIKLTDSAKQVTDLVADSAGNFRAERIAPGTASFSVEADGYMALVQPNDIKVRTENAVDLLVRKRPKNALVNVGKTEITMKQQIQFATDSAVILPESLQLMTEIADAMIRTPRIKRVEIQGHTDNTGTADHNKILSEQRAEAVRSWLTQHGVDPGRLVARGFGQEKPLVPNVTTANKARNRRVQFIILEQDAAAPGAPKTAPKKKDPVFPAP
ncbi:MAG: OmpA family protein [Polyangiaceae bacterium]